MNRNYDLIRGTAILVVGVLAVIWLLWLWLKKSREPMLLLIRWGVTVSVCVSLFFFCRKMMEYGGVAEVGLLLGAGLAGIIMVLTWTPAIVDVVSRKFGNLYTGGDVEIEARPYFSVFQALRAKGKYQEALVEVRKQLGKFPDNFEGQMLLAALQAENLDDLQGAEVTVHRFCNQPGHAPANIAYALNQLADWHLSINKDRDSAQRALEKVVELLPETEMSVLASQRIGRLANTDSLLASLGRKPIAVKKAEENIGISSESGRWKPKEESPEEIVTEYVRHLELHPLDGHIRESLAILYADHYRRLDLAADQLEQLIQQPHQPPRQVVKWLNLLADLQIKHGVEPEKIRQTLQRIIDDYPEVAAAQNTRRRLDMLNLEIKATQEQGHTVKLGSYEQDIGLKGRPKQG